MTRPLQLFEVLTQISVLGCVAMVLFGCSDPNEPASQEPQDEDCSITDTCAECPPGTLSQVANDAPDAMPICEPILCEDNEHVIEHVCVTCPLGTERVAGDDASGTDTACGPVLCEDNERVNANACVACPPNTTNEAGDDASGPDTECLGVAQIVAGGAHTCLLSSDGAVHCWGRNDRGQLGNGTFDDSSLPVAIDMPSRAIALAAGALHTCALLTDNTAVCWGENFYGQSNPGGPEQLNTPTFIEGLSDTISISAGGSHTCALRQDGEVLCWGNASKGQLGNGEPLAVDAPTLVEGVEDAVSISTGDSHTCAVLVNKTAVCWGYNYYGQLGNGTYGDAFAPTPVGELEDVEDIASGGTFTLALHTDGTVSYWGDILGRTQLGAGNPNATLYNGFNNVTAISSGTYHGCGVLSDQSVACIGNNATGELGNGEVSGHVSEPSQTINLASASTISSGGMHTCALMDNGNAFCWGNNDNGQLGNGTSTTSVFPTPISMP